MSEKGNDEEKVDSSIEEKDEEEEEEEAEEQKKDNKKFNQDIIELEEGEVEEEEQEQNKEISNNNEKNKYSKKTKKEDKNNTKITSKNSNESCNGIFINGIPYETKEEELRELFSKYGKIEILKLPKYQDSGRNIGYCHIYYSSPESASKALELDNYTLGKRYLNVSLANKSSDQLNESKKINPNDVPVDCLTAFIRNLPYETTEKDVGDKFRSCGKIKAIRFVYNSKNKKFKGFCYIDFKEHKSLLKALELNGKDFQGRKLQVDFEQNRPKKGFKYNYENLDSKYNREEINILNRKRKLKNKK